MQFKEITSYKKLEAVYKNFGSKQISMRIALEELQERRKAEKQIKAGE